MKRIPCKDCLILPICQSKREIDCNIFWDWYSSEGVRFGITQFVNKYLHNFDTSIPPAWSLLERYYYNKRGR